MQSKNTPNPDLIHFNASKNTITAPNSQDTISWGLFPIYAIIGASGLLLVAMSFKGGRESANWATVTYWIGMITTFMPIGIRLFQPNIQRTERFMLLVFLVILLYSVEYIYSPLQFKFSDEFQHWRAAANVLDSNHLFQPNSMLPISSSYPGLEIMTDAVIKLTGLDIFAAGTIVMAGSRILLISALFLFYERASGSSHIGGVATLVYMTNPHFLFINAMFTYQVAIVFMGFMFSMLVFIEQNRTLARATQMLLLPAILAIDVTHHITSYIFMIFLIGWTIVALFVRRRKADQFVPWKLTLAAGILLALWFVVSAKDVIPYLEPNFQSIVSSFTSFFHKTSNAVATFQPSPNPMIETLLNYGSVGIVALLLPFGVWFVVRRYKANAIALTLGVGSLVYVGSIGIRLIAKDGVELAGRSWIFVFIMVAFVISIAMIESAAYFRKRWILQIAGPGVLLLLFLGSIVGGWPPYWGRLPGPYLVAASERSIEPEGVAAAQWAPAHVGVQNRLYSDLTNYLLMGSYGDQFATYGLPDVFESKALDETQFDELRNFEVKFLLVDYRLTTSIPIGGYYFNQREPLANGYKKPLDIAVLKKFDFLPKTNRIFDSGNIILYDITEFLKSPYNGNGPG